MANEDSVLREVDQELAEDRQWAVFRKYGPALIGGGLAIVAGVGGWQFWTAQQNAVAQRQALEYQNAVEMLVEDVDSGRAALTAVAEQGGSGYAFLAELQLAASYIRDDDRASAISVYERLYNNRAAPKAMRDLARIRAAYNSLELGRDEVLRHLGDLQTSQGAYSHHATEVAGIAALEAKDYESALSLFRGLSINLSAPASIRQRAEDFAALAQSGKAGVNITGEARIDDLLDAIGAGVEALEGDDGAVSAPPAAHQDDGNEAHDHGSHSAADDNGIAGETESAAAAESNADDITEEE